MEWTRESQQRAAANDERIAANGAQIAALAERTDANAAQAAANDELIAANGAQIAALLEWTRESQQRTDSHSEDLRLLIKAVEEWWGNFRAEYGPGPSGRSDDWEPLPNE